MPLMHEILSWNIKNPGFLYKATIQILSWIVKYYGFIYKIIISCNGQILRIWSRKWFCFLKDRLKKATVIARRFGVSNYDKNHFSVS